MTQQIHKAHAHTLSRVSGAAGVLLPAQLVRQPLPVRHPDQAVPA